MLWWLGAALAAVPVCPDVCVHPATYEFNVAPVEQAVADADHTFRVLVFEAVGSSKGTWSSGTERALEESWSSWDSSMAIDAREDVLIVLALDEREVRVKTGSTWDAKLGLWGDALLPFIDAEFLPRAKAGDLGGGLASLVTALDDEIDRRQADEAAQLWRRTQVEGLSLSGGVMQPPGIEAAYPKAAETGAWVAVFPEASPGVVGEKSGTELLLTEIVKRRSLPADRRVVVAGLDEGLVLVRQPPALAREYGLWDLRANLGEDPDAAIVAAVARSEAALAEKVAEAEERERRRQEEIRRAEQRAEEQARRELLVSLFFAVTSALALFLLLLFLWRSRVAQAHERYRAVLEPRRAALDEARANLSDLQIDVETRDRLVELKLKGPVTLATLDSVGELVAELHAGVGALEAQVRGVTRDEPGFAWTPSVWTALTVRLQEGLAFDTTAQRALLFGGEGQQVRATPEEVMARLEESYADARDGWQRILDAAEASLHRCRDDFPADDLQRMLRELAESELPQSWLRTHPLLPEAERTWDRLDAIRRADPVHYLDELDEAIGEDDALEQVVAELLGARAAAMQAHQDVREADVAGIDSAFTDPALDPRLLLGEMAEHQRGLDAALASGEELVGVREHAAALLELAARAIELADATREARSHGAERLAAASALIDELSRVRAERARTLGEMLSVFVPEALSSAMAELGEADVDAREAREAWASAEDLWSRSCHLEAVRQVESVHAELGQARTDLEEMAEQLAAARAEHARAEDLWRTIDEVRAKHQARLTQLAGHASGIDLSQGDTLLAGLRERWDERPADWKSRAVRLETVAQAWATAVGQAEERKRAHDARIARERAARQRARQKSSSSWKSSSSSRSYSSSRSRSSSYSSRSRRSGYSSSSSRSRSSGRSYSSGGRSAGRKW
ncbi:MAG: TPM domain-containing protein [Deltaproteobacteria bacterium]|nr:MAG: TPM domain-containing protein [Deltaproteobacteria bacterium]